MSVILQPVPAYAKHRVLIGTSVRKSPEILAAYLQTLAWQDWPPGVEPSYCFVADTDDPDALKLLTDFVAEHGGQVLQPGVGPQDTNDAHPVTHQWTPSGMARVGQNKNRILRMAQELGVDAVWLVDADLLLDRTAFASLWSQRVPIACAVYWTHWHNPGTRAGQLHCAPQVWLVHPYQLEGRGHDGAGFRRELAQRQRVQVWGQGACTLIRREAIDKGVSFDYVPGVSTDGMMAGEDRHFCLRAEALHLPMLADPWPDIFHVYHPTDQSRIPEMLARLGTPHQGQARVGDWVNVILEGLEPVVTGPNQASLLPPVFYRGRLGSGGMLPELEERIGSMTRGTSSILGVHFPVHHPSPVFRGQRRLVRVTVVDVKPWGYAPVLEDELLLGTETGVVADRVMLTTPQQTALAEDAKAFETAA